VLSFFVQYILISISREIVHANYVAPEFTAYLILFLTSYLRMMSFSVKLNTVICYGWYC